jgi:hypothetical protein
MMKKLIFLPISFIFFFSGFAQVNGDFRSLTTGNWNDATTWEELQGSWGATSNVPSLTSDVEIREGHTVTINTEDNLSKNLLINKGGLVIQSGGTLTTSGIVTFTESGVNTIAGKLNMSSQLTVNPGSQLLVTGSGGSVDGFSGLLLGGTITVSAGATLQQGANGIDWDLGGSLALNGGNAKFLFTVSVQNNGKITIQNDGNLDIGGNLTVLSGSNVTVDQGTLDIAGNLEITGTGTTFNHAGGQVTVGATIPPR